ncbi:MAG: hypothetical protein M3069_15990, partial [Chloroflexota bacterium]|nr:hypothetical protein [Chloroflexota bacterium]
MAPSSSLATWVVVWAIIAGGILLIRAASHRPGAGLVQAYVLNLGLLHWLAATLYLLPWYTNHDPDVVALGLQQGTFAILGFGVGSLLLAPFFAREAARSPARGPFEPDLARKYVQVGLIAFFGLVPIVGRIPTISAIAVQGWNLLVVGLGLMCWLAFRSRREQEFVRWFVVALCLPLVTVVTQGFIGYGMAAATAILAFIGNFYHPRWRLFLAAAVFSFVGLSLYVTYMRDREAIREVVWSGQPLGARISRVQTTLSTFEWFDIHNQDHLVRIDERLNQNLLVGAAVQYVDAGLARYAYGQTLYQGLIAVIPRAIWPTKPVVAGSGSLVTQYTGIQFAAGTAVGIGHVMEAYISFGVTGVLVGFAILGTVIGVID